MGKTWTQQELQEAPQNIMIRLRADKLAGRFTRENYDHNSTDYHGSSNKQIKIVGALLLGRDDVTYDEAFNAVAAWI